MTSNSDWLVVHSVVNTSQNTTVLSGDFVGLLKWRAVHTWCACGLLKWRNVQKELNYMLNCPMVQLKQLNFLLEWLHKNYIFPGLLMEAAL